MFTQKQEHLRELVAFLVILTTKKNHTIAFSIMMQNYVGSSSKAKEFQDEICKILSELK